MEPKKIEAGICILICIAAGGYNKAQMILSWWADNPLMWTDAFGYLPVILIAVSFWLSPKILKRLRQINNEQQ
jgi:hypothetical protein